MQILIDRRMIGPMLRTVATRLAASIPEYVHNRPECKLKGRWEGGKDGIAHSIISQQWLGRKGHEGNGGQETM